MTWEKRTSELKPGDSVAYSADFLVSTGQQAGDAGQARGVIKEIIPLGQTKLAVIEWDNPEIPAKVNIANLARVGGRGFARE